MPRFAYDAGGRLQRAGPGQHQRDAGQRCTQVREQTGAQGGRRAADRSSLLIGVDAARSEAEDEPPDDSNGEAWIVKDYNADASWATSRSPVRRYHLPKVGMIQRAADAGCGRRAVALLVGCRHVGLLAACARTTAELSGAARVEVAEQRRADPASSSDTLASASRATWPACSELERKVRIIANLPGATSAGGRDGDRARARPAR